MSHQYATKLPEYRVWQGMKARTSNPQSPEYHNYGERGITVAAEWVNDFWAFYRHIGPRPTDGQRWSIDRIDNDGNYEPHNVRWALQCEQSRNRRITVRLTYNGVTLTTDQWAAILGCDVPTITMRVKRGWTDRDALEKPIRESDHRKEGSVDRGRYRGKGLLAAFGQPDGSR